MAKRLLMAEDLLKLNFVGDPQVSPQKTQFAYVLTRMDKEKDGYYSSIYVNNLAGENQQMTSFYNDKRLIKDLVPRWSPDGNKLTFLSNRTGENQLWMLPISNGGDSLPLTEINGNVSGYVWSPDGTKIALTVQENPEKVADESDVKEITRLRYKEDGVREFLNKRKHIFLYDVYTNCCEKITEGDVDFYGPCFSPDGKELFYLASKDDNQELEYIPSIWQYDIVNKEEALFYRGKGPIRSLTCSPDGKWVGFIGHDQGETSSFNLNVWAISTKTKNAFNLSKNFDRSVDNLVRVDATYDTGEQRIIWDNTSSFIYFTAMDRGSIRLYKTNLRGEISHALSEVNHTITSFDIVNDQQAILVQAHAKSTGDVVLQNLNQVDDIKKLTNWNDELFDEIKLSTPEPIQYSSMDDLIINGWLLQPTELEQGKKYPLVLQIHGGPHSSYGYGFQHEWQLMASKGYSVLYLNPRGSQGYGQEFVQMVVGDWGGKDYEDLMNGIDYVLDHYDFIDKNNLFATGASYGGYMTNMIGARTERFKALITQNSVTNLYSMFGTSDIGFYFNSLQLDGADMWEDEEKIMKFSPIRYAKNVQTPMLIMHNEKDYRCPMEQAEQWYMALRRSGVQTKLIRFPDEDHGLASNGKPQHRLERLHYLIEWFDTYRAERKQEAHLS